MLYSYPKDDTRGRTTEACELRDDLISLKRMGVALLGVSTDDVKSHHEFAETYHLPFSLLSDAKGQVAGEYEALMSLGPMKFVKRHTFIINPERRITNVYRDVRPKEHSDRVIADLDKLRTRRAQNNASS